MKRSVYPMFLAILAAILFGAGAPLAKLLLCSMAPVPLAAFLYLGSGVGLLLYRLLRQIISHNPVKEAGISNTDSLWLAGAVLAGGVAAPIVLMVSLSYTPAATASLLLNFESVATTFIAALFFKEAIGKRVWLAIICITVASVMLTVNFQDGWGFSPSAFGVLGACILWGMDNNFTRNISAKNPLIITTIKGLGAGLVSLVLALAIGNPLPDLPAILKAMLLGCFSYGISIILFILAMRNLGAARTSALFGIAPFTGALLSFLLFHQWPGLLFMLVLPLMAAGVVLLLYENHNHRHVHYAMEHEHSHGHDDEHHSHHHDHPEQLPDGLHSHPHIHPTVEHEHEHMPDIHHRHPH
jgi:drug/metabolite transporter (DMT)-like permease